ncbi:hypothetical protein HanIR_Chr11g0548541 [Helianthus annuus]|nr:hypothetical protein HanIR_Chr11g0548541 [Helianthus annuus]
MLLDGNTLLNQRDLLVYMIDHYRIMLYEFTWSVFMLVIYALPMLTAYTFNHLNYAI